MFFLDDPDWQPWPFGAVITNYVAEIVFFCFKVGESLLEPSVRLFIYQSVCQHEYPNDATCLSLAKYPWKEKHVQNLSANYIMYYKILLNMPAIVLGLFCGAWSDRIGRKLPVMLPCFGTIVATIFYMVSMMHHVPSLPLVLLGAAIRGAFGKSAVVTMALHSYVSDISSRGARTTKFGRLLAMNFFGYFVGSLMSGTLLDLTGFNVIFCSVVVIDALCVLITLVFMKEHIREVPATDPSVPAQNKSPKIPFHIRHVQESLSVITKPRENKGRLYLLIFYLIVIAQQVCKSGEVDITLLFVEAAPLSWRKAMYGYLLALDYACLGVAVFFILPVLSQRYHFNDITLVVIGLLFKAIRLCLMAFSIDTWMVFTSVIVGCPSAMVITGAKSLISKTVREDEIGKAFSLLSCGETVSNLIGSVIFINIYASTFELFPGLTFLLDSALFVVLAGLIYLVGREIQNSSAYGLLDDEDDPKVAETTRKHYGTNGHVPNDSNGAVTTTADHIGLTEASSETTNTAYHQNAAPQSSTVAHHRPVRPPNSPALRLNQTQGLPSYGTEPRSHPPSAPAIPQHSGLHAKENGGIQETSFQSHHPQPVPQPLSP